MSEALPEAVYVWLVPSEDVLEQPGSWRIRKWDTQPFPEANFSLLGPADGLRKRVTAAEDVLMALVFLRDSNVANEQAWAMARQLLLAVRPQELAALDALRAK